MTFPSSFQYGSFGEDYLAALLEGAGLEPRLNGAGRVADLAGWDLSFRWRARRALVEVKTDLAERKTGNVCLEVENDRAGKPSGLSSTSSDLWGLVCVRPLRAYLASTDELRKYVASAPPLREVRNAGDGNARCLLYRKEQLVGPVFHEVRPFRRGDLLDLLGRLLA